jgi:hypothetical protein
MTDMTAPTSTFRRSFRPAPTWLNYGLLVVEGLLWLSQRYRWFWFNEKKGWTVLIAVASVGVTLLVMLAWFVVSLVFRWRFQFSIRSLLVLTVAVALPCSWIGLEMKAAKRQMETAEAIEQLGGSIFYDWQIAADGDFQQDARPPEPAWLRPLLGDCFFTDVRSVWYYYLDDMDAKLELLKGLNQLKGLALCKIPFADAGLEHIKELSQLQELDLGETEVTDDGLDTIGGLNQLRVLKLSFTQVTDGGLKHLKRLTQLQMLDLDNTKVTDAGVENVKDLNQLQTLSLNDAKITDTGLEHIKGLCQLQTLCLNGTKITDAGLEHIKGLSQLRALELGDTDVTDVGLELLNGLDKLEVLELRGTKVTDECVERLDRALPNCSIRYKR